MRMGRRPLAGVVGGVALLVGALGIAAAAPSDDGVAGRQALRSEAALPQGFAPAATRAAGTGRYFVVMRRPSVAQAGDLSSAAQAKVAGDALASQAGAIRQARSLGGTVFFRYDVLLNGFSAQLSRSAASALAERPDVRSVQPVSIVRKLNETSVPFIGATDVWQQFHARGQGMVVSDVDTGIDYTHANFGGSGDPADYESNNPNFVEPGTFPTDKVIGGYDFVGSNYDVLDDDPTNDIPIPDADPLDRDGHGSHTAGTCCGNGVPGSIGKGVAPKSKLLAVKIWDVGNSTDDVLVAGYEFSMDPNDNGSTSDAADVITFSGGVDYGTLNSVEARAAQRVVHMGTVFVAAAGNSGNQPAGGSAYITGTPANARGVISVAASIDEFNAQTLTVNSPSVTLPDNGIMVQQDWGADLPSGGLTADLFDGREIDAPADPGNESPADQMFCDALPANSLDGQVVLVFKGSTGAGDCGGSTKVFNAQNAGADAVILVSLFGGLPFGLASSGEEITIPAVMISANDGYAILDEISPPTPPPYNVNAVNATLNDQTSPLPGFDDAMTDFTSEGPARLTNDLKPDISAPGFDITSTAVGTGDEAATFSGTSMATPHVSGVAALLRQLHPGWAPSRIKAVLMNQAKANLKNNDLSTPVPATVMGAGRVRALDAAKAESVATPGSLSFGLRQLAFTQSRTQSFTVKNLSGDSHDYEVTSGEHYTDFAGALVTTAVSKDGSSFGATRSFTLAAHKARKVYLRLRLDPGEFAPEEQLFGWYYFNGGVDGQVTVKQSKNGKDTLRVPWAVTPLAASDDVLTEEALDLTDGGSDTMELEPHSNVGTDAADLYLLGATDPANSLGEEDIVAIGARSFTGADVEDGTADAGLVPPGIDPLVGLGWLEFLSNGNSPDDPVEIGVQTAGVHNTTETTEVDVLIDAGADGVFADNGLQADYLVVKLPGPATGDVCVFDLSLADPFDECAETYFADYTNYNGNLFGVAVNAPDIGLTNAEPELSYQVVACTGSFSGDVPGEVCDTAGDFDTGTGTYTSQLNASDPALSIAPITCGGFWGGSACDSGDPITVQNGSATAGDNPSILALFPNNALSRTPTVVTTDTSITP